MMRPRQHSEGKGGLRLLSYVRVSAVRGREGPGFISPTDQAERNRAYACAYGHSIIEEGEDLDRSGGDMSRPTFDRFLDKIRQGDADGIIVAKLDRFARSNKGALEAIEDIERHGGVLISVSEQIDPSTASGRFMRNILLATAQWERDRIGEQWLTAKTSAVDRGIHITRNVPPGYVRTPRSNDPKQDRRLKPHPRHSKTIRKAFEMAANGASDTAIADYLNRRNLPTVKIGKNGENIELPTLWQSSRVPRLLANRAYLGEARSGQQVDPNVHAHPALTDEETWTLAQRRPTGTPRLRRPNLDKETGARKVPSLLSGIVRCAGCGFAMKPQAAGKTSPAIYRCVTTSVHGRCKSPSTISKTRLEAHVLEEFVSAADAYFVGVKDSNGRDPEWHALSRAADDAERSYRTALLNTELRDKIGEEDHARRIMALHDAWQAELAKLEVTRTASSAMLALPAPPAGISLREFVANLRAKGANDELRGLLSEGIEAIFVRPAASKARNLPVADRVKIVFRGSEPLDLPKRGRRFEPRAFAW
jgi:DNA invertase Pin-like site-specific DNA recombinase